MSPLCRLSVLLVVFSGALALVGCGGSEASGGGSGIEPGAQRASEGGERARGESQDADDGILIEGLDGTIRPEAVEDGVHSVLPQMFDCFTARYDDLEVLAGEVTIGFRIAVDGRVAAAKLLKSTLGDRVTERCILSIARTIRFSRPNGGEAEASHSFGVALPEDTRAPEIWPSQRASRQLGNGASLKSCGSVEGALTAAIYIGPGGRPLAAGASGDMDDRALDCVANKLSSLRFDDPGSYPAKIVVRYD